MKAALISNRVTDDFETNQRRILKLSRKAADMGAEIVIFPEAAATGLANNGDPRHDLAIAEPVPGQRNLAWRQFAQDRGVYFVAGLLERDGTRIYDSGVLFNPQGELILHYRRNHPGWHYPEDNPTIYCLGAEIPVVETEFGKVGMLICGDLWDDEILERLVVQKPDYLLYPFLRSLVKVEDVRTAWEEELEAYRRRWKKTGAVVFAVNLYEGKDPDASIGGAWFVDRSGKITASLPIFKEGILFAELPVP